MYVIKAHSAFYQYVQQSVFKESILVLWPVENYFRLNSFHTGKFHLSYF